MKNNIDLTENRMFSRGNFFEDMALGNIPISFLTRAKFPWSVGEFHEIKSDDEFRSGNKRESLIALGDKKQRAQTTEIRKLDSGDYCDCCGREILPWEWKGLCQRCYEELDSENRNKCPWRKNNISFGERRISVFDMN